MQKYFKQRLKMLKVVFFFTLFYISCSWSYVISPVLLPPVRSSLADSTNDFALRFYNQLKYDPKFRKTNLFFSPLSIAIAMGMTHLGARGNTAQEMERSFGWDPRTVNSDFKQLGQALQSNSSEFVLRLANRIWSQQGIAILRSFLRDSGRYFNATMALADFRNAHEQARQEINSWVENKTENKIRELLQRGVVTPSTVMVLVNAIYFKGTWKYQFDKKQTSDSTFYLDRYRRPGRKNNLRVPVKLMRQKGKFNYFYDGTLNERCEVLELPYTGEDTSMFIVLPMNLGSRALRSLEHDISSTVLDTWVRSVSERKLKVFLPRFKVEHYFEANEYLKNLGVRDLFTSAADLSGITGSHGLSVSKVVHKAFVEVNEKGTEAAAATGVVVRKSGIPSFRADHPFLYFIYHKPTRNILFMGRVMNPGQKKVQ